MIDLKLKSGHLIFGPFELSIEVESGEILAQPPLGSAERSEGQNLGALACLSADRVGREHSVDNSLPFLFDLRDII